MPYSKFQCIVLTNFSVLVKGVNFFGSKSEYIVSGSDCGYIFFWDKESEHIVKYMYGDEVGVVSFILVSLCNL